MLAMVCALACAAGRAGASVSFDKDVRPVVSETCLACHNAEKKKGDLDLSQFETEQKAVADAEVWQSVAERLRNGDMPPKKAKTHLSDEQRKLVVSWVETHVAKVEPDCTKIASDDSQSYYKGYVMSRRLTRAEYDNTLRDLIGLDLRPGETLPADGSGGEGFDNDGDALFTSAISIEKYLKAADRVLTAALPDSTAPLPPEVKSAHDRILIAVPDADHPARESAERALSAFVRRAYRRPAEAEDLARPIKLFEQAQSRGASFEASIRFALKSVLISPNFLFLAEPEPEHDGVYRLGDYPLASRLSYFLWSSMPDEELFALAEQNVLHEPDVLRAQVRRMIADPKSVALAQNFAIQWLGLTALGGANRPDPGRFPQFDDDLVRSEREEVVRFFDSIVREDHSLLDLLDARYTFVDERLARLYGIDAAAGPGVRRVTLDDPNRGGVLGMAAVLTSTSYPLRTSPVLRGKWVLEQLLGEKVPPPPPTAGQLPADDRQPDGLSFRQRLERHRSNPDCASCHAKMDPIGFGLENFDSIGRWRTTAGSEPIDATGVLPNGQKFDGPRELKAVLLARKGEFLWTFSRKMLGYALGRELNRYDECVLKAANEALDKAGDRPSALIETIVLSTPFQYRYAKR